MERPKLKHPFSLLVCGPSNCGKSFFVRRLIEEKMIEPLPKHVIWCYGIYQPMFDEMKEVRFQEGLPPEIDQVTDALIIIDDLMNELGNDTKLSNLFTKGSHHRNLSVIFIVQNIFHHGKEMRNVSFNASYMCCFKTVRDKQQIMCLARQMYPGQTPYFMESFHDATVPPYGYLFIDMKPETHEDLRLRTGLFPEDKSYAYHPLSSLRRQRSTRQHVTRP